MPHAFKASEIERRAQDGGRSRLAWHWFSRRTIRAASHYRDWSWARLAMYGFAALAALFISRIDPSQALSLWLFIVGAFSAVWVMRAVVLKSIDEVRRRAKV